MYLWGKAFFTLRVLFKLYFFKRGSVHGVKRLLTWSLELEVDKAAPLTGIKTIRRKKINGSTDWEKK